MAQSGIQIRGHMQIGSVTSVEVQQFTKKLIAMKQASLYIFSRFDLNGAVLICDFGKVLRDTSEIR